MKVGLIDVDGSRFPNLALMRISAYHKSKGDQVEWWLGDIFHYDVVYKSKVFSDAYTPDVPDPVNADVVRKGGTGYAISLSGGQRYSTTKDVEGSRKKSKRCAQIIRYTRSTTSLSR